MNGLLRVQKELYLSIKEEEESTEKEDLKDLNEKERSSLTDRILFIEKKRKYDEVLHETKLKKEKEAKEGKILQINKFICQFGNKILLSIWKQNFIINFTNLVVNLDLKIVNLEIHLGRYFIISNLLNFIFGRLAMICLTFVIQIGKKNIIFSSPIWQKFFSWVRKYAKE